jgi:hypothetical protein
MGGEYLVGQLGELRVVVVMIWRSAGDVGWRSADQTCCWMMGVMLCCMNQNHRLESCDDLG